MNWTPWLMYRFTWPTVERLWRGGYRFDAIDAHYFYPDGVAAAMIARRLDVPVVITARGTDINLIPAQARPRQLILAAAGQAAAMITVCQALKDSLVELGVEEAKVTVLRNGVDLETFHPADRRAARAKLGLHRPTLLSVGGLITRKANDLTIRALAELPGHDLLLAGEGPERGALEALAKSLGVGDRVRFLGRVAHHGLAETYSAADALVLASSREGWANVLLEAMACGTPVVASNVWGTPEVVAAPEAGRLMLERTPAGAVAAIKALFANLPDRAVTRRYAEGFDWAPTTQGQLDLFERVVKYA
jgi:glycosyltransferase involved in cell wall biosynthesis